VCAFNAFAPDPGGKLIYMVIRIAEKKKDRFEIEKQKFAIVDLEQKKIVRTADIPPEEEARGGFGFMKISPDGKFMYLFPRTVLIFDTTDFKLVEDHRSFEAAVPGMAQVGHGRFARFDSGTRHAGQPFQFQRPIVRRSIFGIARFDLTRRSFQFTPIGPSTGGMMGLHVTPDRKTGLHRFVQRPGRKPALGVLGFRSEQQSTGA
jgi:hypothetical protein